jgi:hypothetical protein
MKGADAEHEHGKFGEYWPICRLAIPCGCFVAGAADETFPVPTTSFSGHAEDSRKP